MNDSMTYGAPIAARAASHAEAQTRFLHVGVAYGSGIPKAPEVLEATLDKAFSWCRYSPTTWILWSNTSASVWSDRVRKHLDPGDHMFVCALDMSERQGWLPRWVWEWIRNPTGK